MKGYGKNLGVLGDMAKGKIDYDAAKASAAAWCMPPQRSLTSESVRLDM